MRTALEIAVRTLALDCFLRSYSVHPICIVVRFIATEVGRAEQSAGVLSSLYLISRCPNNVAREAVAGQRETIEMSQLGSCALSVKLSRRVNGYRQVYFFIS